jgi:hypothetical protein
MSALRSWNGMEILAKSTESQKSGPIGLAVILVLCVAVYFLFKSMTKHLKKVRDDFPVDLPAESVAPAPAPPATSTVEAPDPVTEESSDPPSG